MIRMGAGVGFVVLTAMAGCAPVGGINSASYAPASSAGPSAVSSKGSPGLVLVNDDKFKGRVEYRTDTISDREGDETTIWTLVGERDRQTGKRNFYLEWGQVYADSHWHFFQAAHMDGGKALPFVNVERNVSSCYGAGSGCVYSEVYHIELTLDLIRRAGSEGLDLKIFSKVGDDQMMTIPAEAARNLLTRMDQDAPPSAPLPHRNSRKPYSPSTKVSSQDV